MTFLQLLQLIKSQGGLNKRQLLKGGVVEKRLRITALQGYGSDLQTL